MRLLPVRRPGSSCNYFQEGFLSSSNWMIMYHHLPSYESQKDFLLPLVAICQLWYAVGSIPGSLPVQTSSRKYLSLTRTSAVAQTTNILLKQMFTASHTCLINLALTSFVVGLKTDTLSPRWLAISRVRKTTRCHGFPQEL